MCIGISDFNCDLALCLELRKVEMLGESPSIDLVMVLLCILIHLESDAHRCRVRNQIKDR
jgi:hypothetical protein